MNGPSKTVVDSIYERILAYKGGGLAEYEKARLYRLAGNHCQLASLGLADLNALPGEILQSGGGQSNVNGSRFPFHL